MAIDQATVVNPYDTQKGNYWTRANSFITAIDVGDYIAYKNKKDGMFYAVKVISIETADTDNDVTLTVKGVRFRFENLQIVNGVNYPNIEVGDIFYGSASTGGHSGLYPGSPYNYNGFCQNGKQAAMGDGLEGRTGTPSVCISYAEFFDLDTLTITGLLHAGTGQQKDDIEQITVLPDVPGTAPSPSYTTGDEAINRVVNLGTSSGERYLLHGIARQLAWNFKYSVI